MLIISSESSVNQFFEKSCSMASPLVLITCLAQAFTTSCQDYLHSILAITPGSMCSHLDNLQLLWPKSSWDNRCITSLSCPQIKLALYFLSHHKSSTWLLSLPLHLQTCLLHCLILLDTLVSLLPLPDVIYISNSFPPLLMPCFPAFQNSTCCTY